MKCDSAEKMSSVTYDQVQVEDIELGVRNTSDPSGLVVDSEKTPDEESATVENTITPKSSAHAASFLTPLVLDRHQSLTISKSVPLSPSKVERHSSNPVTKEEIQRAKGTAEQVEASGSKSLKLLSLLSQDASKKLKLQRRTGGYFRPINYSAKLFYCTICLENQATSLAFSLEGCVAKHQFCLPCIQTYVVVQINDGIVRHVCPYEGCNALATEAEIRTLVDESTFVKFERFSRIKQDPNYRECTACNATINVPLEIIHHTTDNNELKCAACGHLTCFIHGDSHPRETCKQYGRRINRLERASARTVASTTRKCPQCHCATEKNGGCNHMTCKSCRCEWCWLCGRRVEANHYEPNNILGCPGSQFSMAPDFAIWTCLDNLGCGAMVNLPAVRVVLNFPIFFECWFYNGVVMFTAGLCGLFFFILMLAYLPFVLPYFAFKKVEFPKLIDLFPLGLCIAVSILVSFVTWFLVQCLWLPLALLYLLVTVLTSRCSNTVQLMNKETLLRHFGRPFLMMYDRFAQWYGELEDDEW